PIAYPDLAFTYRVRVRAEGASIRVLVDLDHPIPPAWYGKVGFNLELYPAALFGHTYYSSPLPLAGEGQGEGPASSGLFPRQPNGPLRFDVDGQLQPVLPTRGRRIVIAPEPPAQRLTIDTKNRPFVELYDGRVNHPNGWFIVRTLLQGGATTGA